MREAKPVCVLIGDIHFTPTTLELASSALYKALNKAAELNVPLVINGDTLDSKSVIRAECANRLIDLLSNNLNVTVYINTGNHDLLNEKGRASALQFLSPYCSLISHSVYIDELRSWIIPYHNNAEELQDTLNDIEKGARLIIHQGVQTAYLGHYVQDKTSLPKEAFADFRVIASHYHRFQDIKCGRPRKGAIGLFSYVGSPYSISFSEASDGPKGFVVLNDDGLLTQVPTNLRKHVVVEVDIENLDTYINIFSHPNPDDLLWLKVSGPFLELEKLDKKAIGNKILGHSNFKFDKIATDARPQAVDVEKTTNEELMDSLIDSVQEPQANKALLKALWRTVMS